MNNVSLLLIGLFALFSFQLTLIALIAIIYHRDKLADKAITALTKLSGKLIAKK